MLNRVALILQLIQSLVPQVVWALSGLAFVGTTIVAQDHLIPEPWNHYVAVTAAIASAICLFFTNHPPPKWDGIDRRTIPPST